MEGWRAAPGWFDRGDFTTPIGALYNPASYRGGILRLHNARAPELEPWLDRVAVRGEGVAPFWLRPGEAAVTLGVEEEREEDRIPEPLGRFL